MDCTVVDSIEEIRRGSSLEEELMNYDAYDGWCNSPINFTDQMFPYFTMSPLDGPNFTENYDSDNLDSQLPFPIDFEEKKVDFVENSVIPRSPKLSLDDKMLRALNLFREWSGGGILVQMWVPMKNGDNYILSTCNQPYLLDEALSGYREVSRLFTFAAESRPDSFPGLPGRVFTSKIPEWTSNVKYYDEGEYLRINHAVDHKVRGSIALPVFEDGVTERSCCAVLELVTINEKPDFDVEMENVCRALQAVDLSSSLPTRLSPQVSNKSFSKNQKAALSEIKDVMRAICHAHQLPLALTWIPCSYTEDETTQQVHVRGKNPSPEKKSIFCLEESACYWSDEYMHGFVHACVGHHLEEGQGIVGKALQSNQPFFNGDVKEFHISEYPLVHHARKFGLNAAVAIRLRSAYTGEDDYVLEFFLPVNMKGSREQQLLLNNLSGTMQRMWRSLRKVSDEELLGKKDYEGGKVYMNENLNSIDRSSGNIYESKTTEIKGDGPLGQTKVGLRRQIEKKQTTAEKSINLSVLQQYFSGSLKDAAKSLGVCPTTLKRICRKHGISRWPSRKINKVNRSLKKIQIVIDSVQGVEGGFKFDQTTGFDPSTSFSFPSKNHFTEISDSPLQNAVSSAPSTSCIDFEVVTNVKTENLDTMPWMNSQEGQDSFLKDGHNRWELNFSSSMKKEGSVFASDEIDTKSNVTDSSNGGSGFGSMKSGSSSSSRSTGENTPPKMEASCGDSGTKITVKAIYREDTVRFKFERSSSCFELYEQVGKRFKLEREQFQLKYLDDEEEWVLLVNDSDLHECLEILDYLGTSTVKFVVRDVLFR